MSDGFIIFGVIAGLSIGAFTLLVGTVAGVLYPIQSYTCRSQWPTSFKPEFGLFAGCTIETKDGRIPAKNYRVL